MALRWESWDDECVAYFCWRMAPKLIELPEFDGLPEPALYPCRSCIRQWEDAVITILSWADNGTARISKEFEVFYNGLLYFTNVLDSMGRVFEPQKRLNQQDLLRVIFEIYGSDPRALPETVDYILNLWELIPQAVREDKNTRVGTIIWRDNASAPFAVRTLRCNLYPKIVGLRRGPEGCPFKRVKSEYGNSEKSLIPFEPPMATGFKLCVQRAFHSCRKKLSNMILERYPPRVVLREPDELEESVYAGHKIRLFVGPSGCGKTRQLLQSLERQWGLYLLPGNLPVRPSAAMRPSGNHPSLSNDTLTSRNQSRSKVEDEAFFDELNYRARRSGGSRDTQTWYDDIKTVDRKGFNCWHIADGRFSILLKIRLGVLQDFLDLTCGRGSPADWLNFQTNFDDRGRDIFNDLFRIARLSWHACSEWKWPMSDKPPPATVLLPWELSVPVTPASRLLICIDEAQCDLQEKLQGRGPNPLAGQKESRSFYPFSCMIQAATSVLFEIQDSHNIQMIISGTALQLYSTMEALVAEFLEIRFNSLSFEIFKERAALRRSQQQQRESMDEAIDRLIKRYREGSNLDPSLFVESGFQLLQEDSQFRNLMIERIPDCDEKLHSIIVEHSRPLRGRYQWSVCYLKDIESAMKQNSKISPQEFSKEAAKCCQRVYVAAKEGLKSRLKDIDGRTFLELSDIFQNRSTQSDPNANRALLEKILKRQDQHKKLLDELCWLAVRSDLLGESIIFQSKECAEMVTLGFAFAERSDHGGTKFAKKIVLKERIAIEAAVEYFQAQRLDSKSSRYDDTLIRSFYQEQGNLSALGKKAELFFAWHLKKVLRTPEQRMSAVLPAFSRTERKRVLNLLVGQAKNVEELLHECEHGSHTDTRSKVQFGCDPDQLYLIEGSQTAFQEKSHGDRPETMWGWLKMIREGDPGLKSAFWFPSEKAGPDVVFALRRTASHCDSSPQIVESGFPGPKGKTGELEEEPRKIDNSIILCVVQIKRQAANRDIPGAILSTSPNHWFRQGTKSEAKNILQELNQWSKAGHLIVRILVTSLTDPPTDNPKKKQPMDYLQEEMAESPTWEKLNPNSRETTGKSRKAKDKSRKTKGESSKPSEKDCSRDFEVAEFPLNQQYFNWIGAEHDGDLFGSAFKDFNEAEKNA